MIWHNPWSCKRRAMIGCLKGARHGMSWMGWLGCTNEPMTRSRTNSATNSPCCYLDRGSRIGSNPALECIWMCPTFLPLYTFNSQLQIWMSFHIHSWGWGFTKAIQVTSRSLGVQWINSMWVCRPQNSLVTCPRKQPLDHSIAPVRVKWT